MIVEIIPDPIDKEWIPIHQVPKKEGVQKVRVLYADRTEDCAYWFKEGRLFAWDPNKDMLITHYKLADL